MVCGAARSGFAMPAYSQSAVFVTVFPAEPDTYAILYPSITIWSDDGSAMFAVVLYPQVRNDLKRDSRPLVAALVAASCHLLLELLKAMLVVVSGLGTMGSSCADGEQANKQRLRRGSSGRRMRGVGISFRGKGIGGNPEK